MSEERRWGSIATGNISGTGIAVGHEARATVAIVQQNREELEAILQQLHKEIQQSTVPESSKNVMNRSVSEMENAISSGDPEFGLKLGLERINDVLESIGAAASKVSGIVQAAMTIAKMANIPLEKVAPFLASLR